MAQSDPIVPALEAQVSCYRRLAKLAEQQRELIQQERTEDLLLLLTARQAELDQLAALERVIAPAKKQWTSFLMTLSPAVRQRAETLMAETRSLLEQITSADRNDVLTLQQRKLNLGRQIGAASTGRVVNRAYAASAYGAKSTRLDEVKG